MPDIALIGANCEAEGHPSVCTEPAPGSVQSTSQSSISVNGTEIATKTTADMHFGSHGHDTDVDDNCIDFQTHDIDPDETHSVTLNGSSVYLVGDSTSDPGSGGVADIIDSGSNSSVSV